MRPRCPTRSSSSHARRCCWSAWRAPDCKLPGSEPGSRRSRAWGAATRGCWARARARGRPVQSEQSPVGLGLATERGRRTRACRPKIAVAVHDIEPATFERCALIRDWLDDHGVDRVTLLVIPARDLPPVGERSPERARWLLERRLAGDSIAQHGFQHEQVRRGGLSRRALVHPPGSGAAEFLGLDRHETRRAVTAGWRVLKLAGTGADRFG